MESRTPQGNDPAVQPYIDSRNELAHETLSAMLDGRHEDAGRLLSRYQIASFHVRTLEDISAAWERDSGRQE